ncbi:MAG: DUF1194 domain-containing protein [Phycisphaerales bacterium]|nr:DUF1194 domain-containing protein [Phycisphaerales bacterium]
MRLSSRLLAAACAVCAAPVVSLATVTVDLELSLVVDVSGSISNAEFGLQRGGYSAAFRNASIQNQITNTLNGRSGKIAVNVIYWSGANEHTEVVPWTLLDSVAACNAFADAIDLTGRVYDGQTCVQGALDFSSPAFATNMFDGFRKVIDISSDGDNNQLEPGRTVAQARADALSRVDVINALVIEDAPSTALLNYYQTQVIGGTGAFALQATFQTFATAIAQKLTFEIPTPGAAALLGIGGLVGLRRRR